jgi:hypothetical protein
VFELPNCSITSVETKKSNTQFTKWAIYQVGKTDHLGDFATALHGIEKLIK